MPKDPETGESYDSPKDALAAALPEGVSAEEVLEKLESSGYSLESAGDDTVGVAIGIEAGEEESPEEEKAESEGSAPAGEEETLDISMGMIGPTEGMAKKRDKVAEGLMDKFKKGMV